MPPATLSKKCQTNTCRKTTQEIRAELAHLHHAAKNGGRVPLWPCTVMELGHRKRAPGGTAYRWGSPRASCDCKRGEHRA
jgi:hypothetical protein